MADKSASGDEMKLEEQPEEKQKFLHNAADGKSNLEKALLRLVHLRHCRKIMEMNPGPGEVIEAGPEVRELEPKDVKIEIDTMDEDELEDFPAPEFHVGSKCRFPYGDEVWYKGQIEFLNNDIATVSFLNPTSEAMMICKSFLQQRCPFGKNCRMSHGISVPISFLKEHKPTVWRQALVGYTVLATVEPPPSIWKRALLESWDDELKLGQVVFCEGGAYAKLGAESLALNEHAEVTEDDYDGIDDEDDDNDEDVSDISTDAGSCK